MTSGFFESYETVTPEFAILPNDKGGDIPAHQYVYYFEIRIVALGYPIMASYSVCFVHRNFDEALNTILFMREASASLEGIGVSVLGHLDRILEPYYHNDLMEGRIAQEETKDLIRFFLAMSDVRFEMRKVRPHVGTNTTVVIGGCDAQGNIVFNDITRMILEAYKELRLVDPKLNARLSPRHPQEYFDLLAELTAICWRGLSEKYAREHRD